MVTTPVLFFTFNICSSWSLISWTWQDPAVNRANSSSRGGSDSSFFDAIAIAATPASWKHFRTSNILYYTVDTRLYVLYNLNQWYFTNPEVKLISWTSWKPYGDLNTFEAKKYSCSALDSSTKGSNVKRRTHKTLFKK